MTERDGERVTAPGDARADGWWSALYLLAKSLLVLHGYLADASPMRGGRGWPSPRPSPASGRGGPP